MVKQHIIILGAGAAGLMAARELLRGGVSVTILEARKRAGGRILTGRFKGFSYPVEGGAEFVHGKLECTKKLLKEMKLKTKAARGSVWHAREDGVEKDKDFVDEHHRQLVNKLKSLKKDTTVSHFLQKYFKGKEYAELRQSVKGFVEGYESATLHSFSAKAFLEDWRQTEKWDQYRTENGYGQLIDFLIRECKSMGGVIRMNAVAQSVHWKRNEVRVLCTNGKTYEGDKILVAVPLGILQRNDIHFYPSLPVKRNIWKRLGYGDVIKIWMEFKTPFWQELTIDGQSLKKLFFFFSKQTVPTWWTQHPSHIPLLCGWLSGPKAKKLSVKKDSELLNDALESLSRIFRLNKTEIQKNLKAWRVFNWSKDPFTAGSYSYAVVNEKKFRQNARSPVSNTLFFAGEYLSEPIGTVESALKSGHETAKRILTGKFADKGAGDEK